MCKSPLLCMEEALLKSGDRMTMDVYHAKQFYTISASCHFDEFPGLRVGRGIDDPYGSCYIEIHSKHIEVWNYTFDPVLVARWDHNLELGHCLTFTLHMLQNNKAYLLLSTPFGVHQSEKFTCWGCGTACYLELLEGQAQNVRLRYWDPDKARETWLLGDSYLDYFPQHLIDAGYGNFALDGRPGRGAVEAVASLKHALQRWPAPKRVIWAMGMNDPDPDGTINPDWQSATEELLSICAENGIEPILCTIPNVPERDHSLKNACITRAGCRICDLAADVEPSGANSWYPGLLGKDLVHPTPLGSQAIAMKLISEVPEIQDI